MATFYAEMASVATELLAEFGTSLTIEGIPSEPDPVDGFGDGGGGTTRTVTGAVLGVNYRLFPEGTTQVQDQMLMVDGNAALQIGEIWQGKRIVELRNIKPDDATMVAQAALVRA